MIWKKQPVEHQISELNSKIQTGIVPNVTTGTESFSGNYMSDSTTVTFSTPFKNTPKVIMQTAGGNGNRTYSYRIDSISTTGFSFWLIANSSSYTPPQGTWVAIE